MSVFTRQNIIHEIDDFMNFMIGDSYFSNGIYDTNRDDEEEMPDMGGDSR